MTVSGSGGGNFLVEWRKCTISVRGHFYMSLNGPKNILGRTERKEERRKEARKEEEDGQVGVYIEEYALQAPRPTPTNPLTHPPT